jgi:hypothetical protein
LGLDKGLGNFGGLLWAFIADAGRAITITRAACMCRGERGVGLGAGGEGFGSVFVWMGQLDVY